MEKFEFEISERWFTRLEMLLGDIKLQGEEIMTQLDDLNAQVTAVQTAAAQLGTDLTASIADLQAKLAAALAAGGTPIDLSGPIASLTAIAANLTALDTSSKGL